MSRRPADGRRQPLAGSYRHRAASADDWPVGVWWQIRYYAALQAVCYLTIRIRQPHLRVRVIEHVAVNWLHTCGLGGHPDHLQGVFRDYCRDVEFDVDPKTKNTDWELHRVWTNHAVMLGGEVADVCWRPA